MSSYNTENLLIVVEKPGVIVFSIQRQFVDFGYEVMICNCEITTINNIEKPISGIIIYCDDSIYDKTDLLVYLKDKVMEENIPVFAIGEMGEVKAVEDIIPREHMKESFVHPIDAVTAASSIRKEIDDFYEPNKKKIMIVDDSPAVLKTMKSWLEMKYSVTLANSGAVAIKQLGIVKPDLILMDYMMPIINGDTVFQMIRSDADLASIPIIFLTSSSDKETVTQIMKLRPDGYLLKSIGPEQVIQSIEDYFYKSKHDH